MIVAVINGVVMDVVLVCVVVFVEQMLDAKSFQMAVLHALVTVVMQVILQYIVVHYHQVSFVAVLAGLIKNVESLRVYQFAIVNRDS